MKKLLPISAVTCVGAISLLSCLREPVVIKKQRVLITDICLDESNPSYPFRCETLEGKDLGFAYRDGMKDPDARVAFVTAMNMYKEKIALSNAQRYRNIVEISYTHDEIRNNRHFYTLNSAPVILQDRIPYKNDNNEPWVIGLDGKRIDVSKFDVKDYSSK